MPDAVVERIRRFNRTWTEVLRLLDEGLLETDFSLAEARVLFELAHRDSWERQELRDRLEMDASFLTRVVNRLVDRDLVVSTPSEADGRAVVLALTKSGRDAFDLLNTRAEAQIAELIDPLTGDQRAVVVEAMTVIAALIRPRTAERKVTIRGLEAGDMGWVVQRHGAIYADEFGWNADFEGLVARIVADYHAGFEPGRENAWMAEVDGARAGCVFCCARDSDTAQLRMLLVEPWARGMGLGHRLVDECIAFATRAGYSTMMLWTNDLLVAARRIYEAAGFQPVDEEAHHSFGHDLIGQNWTLDLTSAR